MLLTSQKNFYFRLLLTGKLKNEGADIEAANLFVKEIYVDSARQLKRLRPAPQGRGYRTRKRSNHGTLVLGNKQDSAIARKEANKDVVKASLNNCS